MPRQSVVALVGLILFLNGCGGSDSDMVLVEAGWFRMGQNDEPPSARPAHRVYLDAFAIDRTEVTRGAFVEFVQSQGQITSDWDTAELLKHPDLPVTGVLWKEAEAYCRWIGKRLPTEAVWEKAARGKMGYHYPWGDQWDPARCNTVESGSGAVRPVGSYPRGSSPYGAVDMAGNAAEWVADYYQSDYYLSSPAVDPRGPSLILDHVLRGGSYASSADQVTTFFRDSSHSVTRNPRNGFRCAKSLPARGNPDVVK